MSADAAPTLGKATLLRIAELTAESFGVTTDDLLGRRRFRAVAEARMACETLVRAHSGMSVLWIAGLLGVDHAAILHAQRRVRELAQVDARFARKYDAARARVAAEFPAVPAVSRPRSAPRRRRRLEPEDFLQPA